MNKVLLFVIVLVFGAFVLLYESEWFGLEKIKRSNLLPDSNYKPSIVQGKNSYQSNCMECHGDNLLGSAKGPSLLDDVYKPSHHADLSFYYAVKNGVKQHHWRFGDMPMITRLSPERVKDIITYVRQQQRLSNIQ